ncbi:2-C-methyl-D-erythritol 4-phosphate cytidylyltransferase [bacterium]|nr:2-C-methyl-D-erythritol 4-phosphate cytidylyltransferase [bacterium]
MGKLSSAFILASGGIGQRFENSRVPKQYFKVNKIPILMYSLSQVNKLNFIDQIIIIKNKNIEKKFLYDLLTKYKINKHTTIVDGGKSRFESVKNAINEINIKNNYIIIHDAVRPNFNFKNLKKMMKQIDAYDGIIPVEKIDSTIKNINNEKVVKTLSRENLYLSQTPQVFKTQSLLKGYNKVKKINKFTDESEMLERNGFRIKSFLNKGDNLKITTKDDLEIFKKLLK